MFKFPQFFSLSLSLYIYIYVLKLGRQENLTSYFFDHATLSINKIQLRNGQKAGSSLFLRKRHWNHKNYWDITITAISINVYNAMLLNHIQPEIEKILRKIRSVFWEINLQLLWFKQSVARVCAKKLEATLLFVNFSKAFDSIHRGKIEQILLVYGLPKETVRVIMMFYKNTKTTVDSLNDDTDCFDIVARVLPEGTLAPYIFIICLDYELRTSIVLIKKMFFH